MTIAISPRHIVAGNFLPLTEWPLDLKIDVFLARIDGWHLEVADRCINGWLDSEGKQSINALSRDTIVVRANDSVQFVQNREIPWNHIPDSGWAVLQIVFNYFEVVGLFKFFRSADASDTYELFKTGFFDVFPKLETHGETPARICFELRNHLYHKGVKGGGIFISGNLPEPVTYDHKLKQVKINPHSFVRALREHLGKYGADLKNTAEVVLRAKFEAAFYYYYLS